MCEFCEGKETIKAGNGSVQVESNKYLVVRDSDKEYVYDLGYCPLCGEQLHYNAWKRVWVSNIVKDRVMSTFKNGQLHAITCDKRLDGSELTEKRVCFIVSEKQLEKIRKDGYCDILCANSHHFMNESHE